MERKSRRKFSADFKAKVVIEALKERNTIEQLAKKFDLHPNQITTWKKEFLANAAAAFGGDKDDSAGKDREADTEKLYAQIGQLQVENNWLKKKLL
jgi:transposase-like protein